VDKESLNPADNKYVVDNERLFVVNVTSFMTMVRFDFDTFHEYDLREPVRKVVFPDREITSKTAIPTNEWKNIPYYPTSQQQQQQQLQQQLIMQQMQRLPTNTGIFSPDYARLAGIKPRATTSANIGLGGVRR
jgi:hypothetical protein